MKFMSVGCLIMITVSALAQGGAFEPDPIIAVDTVEVLREIPLRVDTVYIASARGKCGYLELNDGRVLRATHARPIGNAMAPILRIDGRYARWKAYRSCDDASVVHLELTGFWRQYPQGYAWVSR